MQRRELLAAGGAIATLGAVAGCAAIEGAEPAPLRDDELPPPAPREWRAAWVASVAHIDWPSRPGLTSAQHLSPPPGKERKP